MKALSCHMVFFFLLPLVVHSQDSKTDQAYGQLEMAIQLADSMPDSALQYANNAELVLVKDDPRGKLARLYERKGHIYELLDAPERSLSYYRKAYEASIREEDMSQIGSMALELGNQYYNIGDFSEAYSYFMQSLHAFENADDIQGIASMENNLGLVAHEMGKLEEAKTHYEKAYQIYQAEGGVSEQCQCLNNIGAILFDRESLDSALLIFRQALEMVDDTGEDDDIKNSIRSGLLNNMALVYSEMGDHRKALDYLLRSLSLSRLFEDDYHMASLYLNLGATYSELGNADSALYYLHHSLEMSRERNYRHLMMEIFDELAGHHARTGGYASAYNWRLRHDTLYKDIFNENQSEQIARLRSRYEQEISDRRIEQLNAETQVQRTLNKVFVLSILIIVILAIVIAVNLRAKNKANKLLEEQNEKLSGAMTRLSESEKELQRQNHAKDRIFTVIAHDLRNPVAAVSGFSELLYENFDQFSADTQKEYMLQIVQGSQRILGLLENLLIWARTQMDVNRFDPMECRIADIIGECVEELKANIDYKKIDCQVNTESDCSVFADKDMITIVIRNLLGNAIKYSFPGGKIRISSEDDGQRCKITISDEGIGIPPEIKEKLFHSSEGISSPGTAGEPGSGLGLVICKEFVEQNGGSIAAESESGNGSTFIIELPTVSVNP